jgi:predicted metal-dependent hydrolase
LKTLIDLFIEQEFNHTSYHRKFNNWIVGKGYRELLAIGNSLARDLNRKVREDSLERNMAFCAGFENVATIYTKYLLVECDRYFATAEPQMANLFLWHFAEEFEHRVVAHDVFDKVSGNYWLRVWGMLYAPMFVMRTNNRLVALLLDRHRAGLSWWQKFRSRAVSLKLSLRMWSYLLPRIALMLRPGYHPSSVAVPERVSIALKFYSSDKPLISMPF